MQLEAICVRQRGNGVAKGGPGGPGPLIFQTIHKYTFKLHEIGQFGQFKNNN